MKPFRWDLGRREQLGRLVEGEPAEAYDGFLDDLRCCAARVVAMAGDVDLAFVGRSPESLFDYLSGALGDTSRADRLDLLNLSMRHLTPVEVRELYPGALPAARAHLEEMGLAPRQLVFRPRPVTLVDLVFSGSTFRNLTALILGWAEELALDLPAVRRKLRFLAVTWRTHTSPNTWRWWQHAPWLDDFPRSAVKSVSAPGRLWRYLGNEQKKVAATHPPWRWNDPTATRPERSEEQLAALRLAVGLYDAGRSAGERARFGDELCRQPAMRHAWCRGLVAELRGVGAG